jgi:amino acid transporter
MSAEDGPETHLPARIGTPGHEEARARAEDGLRTRRGRHLADRRIHVDRPRSRYFRVAGPGVVTAKDSAATPTATTEQALFRVRRLLFGRLLRTEEELEERLSKVKALATFSSDNLSSVAYATEASMFTLLAAGTAAFWLVMPISALIVGIFLIIVISYRQTIRAYPSGGGSYIVAKENLGTAPAVLAAAALLTDYVLTVSVSVAAGVAAIASAFPGRLDAWIVPMSVVAIAFVMLINLRGIRESGTIFAIPTYLFVLMTLGVIGLGIARTLLGDAPQVTGVVPALVKPETLGLLLVMRAFADGCSAITGVEAVSNGVPAFKPPEWRNARTTLTVMGILVAVMFLGLSILAGIAHTIPSTHETVISQIGRSVYGTGPVYYLFQLATTGVLILAANTSFADFPRLASILARDGFMPRRFAFRGERLAFSAGIVVLALIATIVLIAFGGRVEALIPLYAIGVFTSITISQAGMVRHWFRTQEQGWRTSAVINAVGAVATAIVTVIFAVAKFALGAWLIVIIIPILVTVMMFIHGQYERRRVESSVREELVLGPSRRQQHVVVPVPDVTREVIQAIKFGRTMSDDVQAVHVTDDLERGEELRRRFSRQVPGVPLVLLESPYRQLVRPLIHYFEYAALRAPNDVFVVLLPEYVPRHWWENLLYNDNGRRVRDGLLGRPNVVVANVPYRRDT